MHEFGKMKKHFLSNSHLKSSLPLFPCVPFSYLQRDLLKIISQNLCDLFMLSLQDNTVNFYFKGTEHLFIYFYFNIGDFIQDLFMEIADFPKC